MEIEELFMIATCLVLRYKDKNNITRFPSLRITFSFSFHK